MTPMVPVVVVFRSSPIVTDSTQQSTQQSKNDPAILLQAALHTAARHNDTAALMELLEQGANLTKMHSKGNSVLHTAAYHGAADFIQELSKSMPPQDLHRLVNQANEYGSTPLHSAAKKGHFKTIERLLSLGADPTIRDQRKRTPLDLALKSKYTKAVEVLRNPQPPQQDTFIFTKRPKTTLASEGRSMETLSKSTSDSKLNPFAQPFSPSRFSHNLSANDLQLPTTADLGELLAIHDQDPAEHNGPAPLAEHQDIFSSMGSSPSGRLNIFTGQWNDPFLPQKIEESVLGGLSILNRINSKLSMDEVLSSPPAISRNNSHHNIFMGHTDPFTPIRVHESLKDGMANPFKGT